MCLLPRRAFPEGLPAGRDCRDCPSPPPFQFLRLVSPVGKLTTSFPRLSELHMLMRLCLVDGFSGDLAGRSEEKVISLPLVGHFLLHVGLGG